MSAPTALGGIAGIALAVIPEIGAVVSAVKALTTKYPSLTAEQIQSLVAEITNTADAAFDDVIKKTGGS